MAALPTARAEPAQRVLSRSPWRQPVVWLALVVFLASIAGCILTIVLAVRHAEPTTADPGERIFRVPIDRAPSPIGPPAPRP
ncbi:MAG: hypothetical protein AB7G13_09490 [Lautropia sp.]